MNIELINKNISDIDSEILVEFLAPNDLAEHEYSQTLESAGFKAEQDSTCFLYEKRILFCGVEKKKNDEIRSAVACMIKVLKTSNYKSAKISVASNSSLTGLVEGIVLGGYEFNNYKSEPKEMTLKEISLAANELDFDELQTTFNEALIVANATCFTRDIVNNAPQEVNPQTMVALAMKLANDNSLECNILHEEGLAKENMGAMLAVGRASVHGSALIHLAYKPANPKKVISLIGKGLTYDSG
ncbi:MAG: leucyl aminopeptidase family protein, partial [Sulfurimonas sp.]|nr:leucyl aminopeptidase family protein [Sulfurimonas sp.]